FSYSLTFAASKTKISRTPIQSANACKILMGSSSVALKPSPKKSRQADTEAQIAKSWEQAREGLIELNSSLHEMGTMLLYASSAILAKENVLIDGPGGGAKTFAIRQLVESQIRATREKA